MTSPTLKLILLYTILAIGTSLPCSHDVFSQDQPKTFYNDLTDARLLQTAETGRYKLFNMKAEDFCGLFTS